MSGKLKNILCYDNESKHRWLGEMDVDRILF